LPRLSRRGKHRKFKKHKYEKHTEKKIERQETEGLQNEFFFLHIAAITKNSFTNNFKIYNKQLSDN